jgi:hypothetical protein
MIITFCLLICSVFEADQQWQFCGWLETESQLSIAASEYQRFAISFPDDERTSRAWWKSGCLYNQLEEYELAATSYSMLTNDSTFQTQALYQLHYLHELKDVALADTVPELLASASMYIQLIKAFEQANLDSALAIINSFPQDDTPWSRTVYANKSVAETLRNYSIKNPWLYGTYSTILPGLGQLVLNRKTDALLAFNMSVGLGLLSYYYYREDNKPASWGFGIPAIFFYLGNIYGAANTAKLTTYENQIKSAWDFKTLLEDHLKTQEQWCPCCQ